MMEDDEQVSNAVDTSHESQLATAVDTSHHDHEHGHANGANLEAKLEQLLASDAE